MRGKLLLVFLVFLVSSSAFFAETCANLTKKYGTTITLPSAVSSFFNGDKLNLVFKMNDGSSISANGKIGSKGIENIKCGLQKNPNYLVSMDEDSVVDLVSSKDKVKKFKSGMKDGSILVTPYGFGQSLKLKIAEIIISTQ